MPAYPTAPMSNTEAEAYTEALQRIKACRKSGTTKLYLTALDLTALPREIGRLSALTELSLDNNQLSTLPPEIGQLTALTKLSLASNQLSTLPSEIGQLTALTHLVLYGNQLSTLPPEIGQLTALTRLDLEKNQLSTLSPEIGQLTALTHLVLHGNQLSTLPPEIGQLTALTQLSLGKNQLSTLPLETGQLTALTELVLTNNQLSTLPPEIGQLTALTKLDLSGNQLSTFPPEIGQLTALTRLDLEQNQIGSLPPEIGQLTALTRLDLNDNQLSTLPPEIGQLSALTLLILNDNQLSTLPSEIGQLTALKQLILWSNELSTLPPEIGKLTGLKHIFLFGNKLSTLPPEIGQLTALTELVLPHNQLSTLPPEIGQLTALTKVELSHNQLSTLPPEIGQLTALTKVDLSHNQLSTLPPEIGQLSALTLLDLNNNQLSTLPSSLKDLRKLEQLYLHENDALGLPVEVLGPDFLERLTKKTRPAKPADILAYYFATQRGSVPLNEAKIIFVGRGGAGKTTLRKQLMKQRIPKRERRTKGIDLRRWELDVGNVVLGLNLWDFGGQEVMYSTHQFFLTERAVYVLVLDARSGPQDENVDYWLRLVSELGKDSPVIMVLNHVDENEGLKLDDTGWQDKFPFVCASVRTCATKGKNIDKLVAALRKALKEKLPEARREFPKEWWEVKRSLTEMRQLLKHDYITYQQYEELCQKHKVKPEDMEGLLKDVRDLGLVSYFPELNALGLPAVLQPGWLTGGLYSLIDNPALKRKKGLIKATEVYGMLRERERYERAHGLLFLKVAEHFRLGFAVPGAGHQYVLTALLDERTPRLPHWKISSDELRLDLRYTTLLPEGLLAQFIALAHELNPTGIRWRNGVELALDKAEALVTADVPAKRIAIRIRGQGRQPRALLSAIRAHFRTLHQNLTPPEELVPVPGIDAEPVLYSHLLALEMAEVEEAQVTDRSGELHLIPVKDLLDNYASAEQRSEERLVVAINKLGDTMIAEGKVTRKHIRKRSSEVAGVLHKILVPVIALAEGRALEKKHLEEIKSAIAQGQIDMDTLKSAVTRGLSGLESAVLGELKKLHKGLSHPGQQKPWRFLAMPKSKKWPSLRTYREQEWEFYLIDEHTDKILQPAAVLEFKVPKPSYLALIRWLKRSVPLAYLGCGVTGYAITGALMLGTSGNEDAQSLAELLDQASTVASSLGADSSMPEEANGVEAVDFFQQRVLPANPAWQTALTQVRSKDGGYKWISPRYKELYPSSE